MCIMSRVSCQPCFTGVVSSVMLAHHGNASDYEQHSLPWLRSCLRCGRNHNPLCSLLVDACGAGGELSGPVAKVNQKMFMSHSHKTRQILNLHEASVTKEAPNGIKVHSVCKMTFEVKIET